MGVAAEADGPLLIKAGRREPSRRGLDWLWRYRAERPGASGIGLAVCAFVR